MSLRISRKILLSLGIVSLSVASLAGSSPAAAVDWAKVPAKKIMMMYPAQVSWDRLMTPGRHSGRNKWIAGKNCLACHGNIDEHPLGDSLVHGEKFIEPTPIEGKPGAVDAQVKVARDAENLYVRLEFDPLKQPDAGMDKDFETKVTMMLDDAGVPEMTRAGCWAACHDDVVSMPRGGNENTKYTFESRKVAESGGIAIKDAAELAKLKADSKYLEYWQARLNPGKKAVAVDGIVLDKRAENKEPEVKVEATQTKGVWTVTFTRKLAGSDGHKPLVAGKTYTVGFAIHAGHTAKRFHYVSFERTLSIDSGSGDFVATAN